MKKIKLLLFAVGVFVLIGAPKVEAHRIFKYIPSEGGYSCVRSGPILDLSLESTYNTIQYSNACIDADTPVSEPVQKETCEDKNGTFYPAIVTEAREFSINNDATVNYLLIAYNMPININAKVTFIDDGGILGTIGENGKIVINENGKIEFSDLSEKLFGNTSDYQISFAPGSSITLKTLGSHGEVFPTMGADNYAIPPFLNSINTMSEYVELKGNFKINSPFTLFTQAAAFGSKLLLKENSTLDLLSNLTIDNKSTLVTELNSKLLNSATLNVNGKLDINGQIYNGYKLDTENNPITTNTGSVTIGTDGKITLIGDATGLNNSINDIPVLISTGNVEDTPVENVIPGNGPRSINISSEITNGTVTSSVSRATSGQEIELNITPRNGYKIKKISVLDRFGDQEVPVTNNKFIMPSYNVFVNVEFELDIVNPRTSDNILYLLLIECITMFGLFGTIIYINKKKYN